MTKLLAFDDGSKLIAQRVDRTRDTIEFEIEGGEVHTVPAGRVEYSEWIAERTMAADGLRGTLTLETGDSVSLPLDADGIATEMLR